MAQTDKLRDHRKEVSRDIVDLYKYPIVFGRTHAFSNKQRQLQVVDRPPKCFAMSESFAWLPARFTVSSETPLHVSASSYIPDIPPSCKDAPIAIQNLLAQTIPLFEHVLTDLTYANPLPHRIRVNDNEQHMAQDELEQPEHSDDEDAWLEYERMSRVRSLNRLADHLGTLEGGYTGGLECRNVKVSLKGKVVTVFTRVTDICLVFIFPSTISIRTYIN